jgi:lauroyl/myristoyl acyltransferase
MMESITNNETSGRADPAQARRYWYSRMLGLALRCVPRAYRFQGAVWSARLAGPAIRATALYREQRKKLIDGPLEIALDLILSVLTRDGIDFELRLRVSNFNLFEAAVRSKTGVLLISPHAVLGVSFLKYLHERGYQVCVVSPLPDPHRFLVPNVPIELVSPGRTYLFEVRERLRKGEIVGAMIDRATAIERRTFPVETVNGTLHLAGALLEVAQNAGAQVVFFRSWVEGNAIAIELSSPSPASERTADSIARDFARFIQRHVSSRRASGPDRHGTRGRERSR